MNDDKENLIDYLTWVNDVDVDSLYVSVRYDNMEFSIGKFKNGDPLSDEQLEKYTEFFPERLDEACHDCRINFLDCVSDSDIEDLVKAMLDEMDE